jgi:hypothetical protein
MRMSRPRSTAVWTLAGALTIGAAAAIPASATGDNGRIFVPGAAQPWVTTNVTVDAGQTFTVRADGAGITWLRAGPGSISGPQGQDPDYPCVAQLTGSDCAMNGAPFGALVAEVGGQPLLIGAGGTFQAPASGTLRLAVNDILGYYFDNSGGYAVRITTGT